MLLKVSTVRNRTFLLVQSADHLTGLTGATPTVTLSKDGAAFAAAGGTVTEIANGWYKVALTTTDTNTKGDLAYHVTAASGDPTDFADQVVTDLPGDSVASVTGAVGSVTGGVTVTTNNDKTGYSLTQTFPTNFSSLAITAGGAVTVGTNSDKTGYTLTVTPPTSAQIATAVWQDTTAGDFTTASSIGKSLYTSGNAPGAASGIALVGSNMGSASSVTGAVGSVTGNVGGNVVGSVGSVTGAVTVGGYSAGVDSVIRRGTAQAGGATSITLDAGASSGSQEYQWTLVSIIGGTGAGQAQTISSYNGSTKVATVALTWLTNPDSTSQFIITGLDTLRNGATGYPYANVRQWNDSAVSAVTAGIPDVNVKNINNTAAATPGAAGGLFIAGTNAPVTITGSGDALTLSSSAANGRGLVVAGNGSGSGATVTGGATGPGLKLVGGGTSGDGLDITTTSGDGISILPTAGSAVVATGNGTSKFGIIATGGTGGTSDGVKAVAGTGGVPIRGDLTGNITGNITGNLSGSVASVSGAVGSVTGSVGGSVAGSVASVTAGVTLATGAITSTALATTGANAIADGVLDRDMSTGTDSGSASVRTVRQALRVLRNKVDIPGGTVYKEDDSTASWTFGTTTAAGNPVTVVDPT